MQSGDNLANAFHGFGLSLDHEPGRPAPPGGPAERVPRPDARDTVRTTPGIGAPQAAARAELRRRRASAYRHLRAPRKRGRVLRIVLIAITVFAAIGAGTVGAVFAGYNAYKSQLPERGDHHQHGAADRHRRLRPTPAASSTSSTTRTTATSTSTSTTISPYFKEAIVAIEDHNFYTEGSWDLARLVESGVADVTHRGASLQGGSTITEQLAKISLYGGADPPQSIDYKIKEIVLGNEIALNFTKSEILDMYVNRIFYGNFAVGVGSAAELYFRKPASQLDLAQAAMLAGLPQSPTAYNPLHPRLATRRSTRSPSPGRRRCSRRCSRAGYITQAQGVAAYAEKLTVHSWTESEPQPLRPRLRRRTSRPT